MGHFKVSVQVWHNGDHIITETDTVYSEPAWAAEHPEVLLHDGVIAALGQRLQEQYGD